MFTPTADLFAELQSRQQRVRVCKEADLLICPTIFGQPPRLPEFLTAMGFNIEWSVRTKTNAVCCRGFFFDIENGDMTPEDFGGVFLDLEFFAYSSWSHTPGAPRYRIGIPSTQVTSPEVHVLILHAIIDRLRSSRMG